MWRIFLLLLVAVGLISCSEKHCEHPLSAEELVSVEMVRVDEDIYDHMGSPEELATFLDTNPAVKEYFFQRSQYPSREVWANQVYGLMNDPNIQSLRNEIDRVFGDLDTLEQELAQAFTMIRRYYPDFRIPKVKTVFTGFANDLMVTDSLIVIGLDFYLGKGAKYRPVNFPQYILTRYAPEFIVPSIVLLESKKYNAVDPKDNTMLADMIFYGKSYHFAEKVLPCSPDSLIIFYSQEQIIDVKENQDIVWAYFLQNELLYETSEMEKNRYLGERPKVVEIGNRCPGRVGAWLGWRLVRSYVDRNDINLNQLMQTSDPRRILNGSRYRP